MKKISIIVFFVAANVAFWNASNAGESRPSRVRVPAVAGQFYPTDARMLEQAIKKYAEDAVPVTAEKPIALILPHAGYIYSGQICADGYRQAMGQKYDTIVILGTNHTTTDFNKISVYARGAFKTPLGEAKIDETVAAALLAKDADCRENIEVHEREHSVEVQVPFIQVFFPSATIVPVIVGDSDLTMCTHFGQVLAQCLKDRRALIVASSDLSHYPSYKDAVKVDRQTLSAIAGMEPRSFTSSVQAPLGKGIENLLTCACGEAPILASMAAAKQLGATHGIVLSYANSGDVPVGNQSRVVGYGSVALVAGPGKSTATPQQGVSPSSAAAELQNSEKKLLLAFARETIQRYLTTGTTPLARGLTARLRVPQAVFVTLTKHGELRGCMGQLLADLELGKAVGTVALDSALNDSRFSPLTLSELPEVEIEISALTPMKPIEKAGLISLGKDGVLLEKAGRRSLFLPQVATEQHWGRTDLLDHLCVKAGLSEGCWQKDAKLSIFQAEVFSESDYK
jgi:MEMO1 family protein